MTLLEIKAAVMALLEAIPALERLIKLFRKTEEQKIEEVSAGLHKDFQDSKDTTGRPPA